MLERRVNFWREWSFAIDWVAGLLLISATFAYLKFYGGHWEGLLQVLTGYPFRIQTVGHLEDEGWLVGVIFLGSLIGLRFSGFYGGNLFAGMHEIAWQAGRGLLIGSALAALFYFFFGIVTVNRSLLFLYSGLFFIWLVPKEWLFRRYLRHRLLRRERTATVLVGDAQEIGNLKKMLRQEKRALALKFVRCFTPADYRAREQMAENVAPAEADGKGRTAQTLAPDPEAGWLEELPAYLSGGGVDLLVVSARVAPAILHQTLCAADDQGVECWILPSFPEDTASRVEVDHLGGLPLIVWKSTAHYERKFMIKRVFDLLVTFVLLPLVVPLLALAAAGILLTAGGPVLFRQERTGWRGRPFVIFKLRTMHDQLRDGEGLEMASVNEVKGPVFKNRQDPRVFPFGRFLRRFSIDELPQLWNVVRGDMSLVGPRPFPVEETRRFSDFRHHRRHSVLPGMTGLWQVSGRSGIEDFEEWVRLDLAYIDQWSLGLDLKIILRTLPAVLRARGAS